MKYNDSVKYAICNEMFRGRTNSRVAETVASLGYHGVELAPFTLGEFPDQLPPDARKSIRNEFESRGLAITGLHWLLVGPGKFSVTTPEPEIQEHTRTYLTGLIGLCSDLGGKVMVFGSPKQRSVEPGDDPRVARERVVKLFRELAPVAGDAGVCFCFEPLTPAETNFINTMKEGVTLVEEVGHPAFQLHLDVKAMAGAESGQPADVIREEGGRHLRYFHANDPNLLGPGMGKLDQEPIGRALRDIGYNGWVSVETFLDGPGPEETARQSMETLKKCYG